MAIGESAAGDVYLLDTADAALPVACLSHETHAIEPEWPTFAAFVDEWLRAPDEIGPGSDPPPARPLLALGGVALFVATLTLLMFALAFAVR